MTNWRYLNYLEDVAGALLVGTNVTYTEAFALTSDFAAFLPGDVAVRIEADFYTSPLQAVTSNVRGSRIYIGTVHNLYEGYLSE